ncbi:MAG TPA: hypothetical protein VEQ85_12130 [Lacipirellulaceae bacterium]|nr:hypothetical protein [Lacipirellulaceae bacterium]
MGAVREHSVLIACIGAGSAIVAAFAKPICDALYADPPAKPAAAHVALDKTPQAPGEPITPTPHLRAPIEGAWKQYVLSPEEGAVYLGTFVVSRLKDEYIIAPRTQTEGERFMNSIGVTDVSYDGAVWSFNSNWGAGEVGNFELQRVSPSMFEGEIRMAGKFSNRTRFVKIE